MRPLRSIRWRLQCWHGWLLALVLGGFGFTAYQLERAALIHSIDDELHGRLSELATALRPSGPGGAARPRPAPPEPAGERPPPPNEPPPPEGLPPPNSGVPHGSLRVPPSEAARCEGGAGRQWYFVIWAHNGPAVTRSPERPPDCGRPTMPTRSWWRGVPCGKPPCRSGRAIGSWSAATWRPNWPVCIARPGCSRPPAWPSWHWGGSGAAGLSPAP